MEHYVLKEIETQDKRRVRVYVTISENSIELIVFQNEEAWKSVIIKNDLQHFAKEHNVTLENYCTGLLEHIRNANSNVVFILNSEEFIINKLLKASLMVKYFSSKLKKVNYAKHVEQIMDMIYSENIKLAEQLNTFQKENEEINKRRSQCESKLKELISKKVELENEQYGQFLLILNEKKRQIQHLTELLEAFKNGRPTVNPVVKVGKRKRKKDLKNAPPQKKMETISASEDSDSDEKNTSDDHDTESNDSIKENPEKNIEPSTSGVSYDFLEDDFAQSHILPKRVKSTQEKNEAVVMAPPSPKSPPKTEELETAEKPKSPAIDLSTQQLLDML